MTELEAAVAIVGSSLAAAGVVLAAVLPVMISTRRKAVAATQAGIAATAASIEAKEAVTNGHPEHIRDMLDRYHAENRDALHGVRDEIVRRFEGVESDIRGVRRDVGRVTDTVAEQGREIRALQMKGAG